MPCGGDAARVAPGDDISFPQNGPCDGGRIARASENSFALAEPGTYQVQFVLSASKGAQAVLTLNGAELPYTAAGADGAKPQIMGASLVTTNAENSVLTVRNPCGNTGILTLSPRAGGNQPVSAHLLITRLK